MRKITVFLVIVSLVFLILGFSAFGQNIKYGGTLRVVYAIGSNLIPNFSPYNPSPINILPLIYESLFDVNILNGQTTPLLGTSYKWEDNDLKLVVNIRQGVKWSDGTPFTANDVAFTFNYLKQNPSIDLSGIWAPSSYLESVQATGGNVIFSFYKANTPFFLNLATRPIIPEHIWSRVKNPSEWDNPEPIGTGPFIVKNVNVPNNTVTLTKNPNYWMKGRPYVDNIAYTVVLSNTTALEMLLANKADLVGAFIPNIQQIWANRNPSINKYWWPVYSINILLFNTLKYPFNNSIFRRAVNFAINKSSLEEKAYYNVGGTANPTGIIPLQLDKWMDPTLTPLASELGSYNSQKAQDLLTSIGFKKNSNGRLVGSNGEVLPTFKILVPVGATDFITMAQIISENLKNVGIYTVIDQEAGSTYMTSLMSGTFDMAISSGAGIGPSPYYLYYSEFNPAFSAQIGQTAISDYSRYTNPLVTAALQVFSSTSDLNLQQQAIYTIERIMLMDLPFIPLTNRTMFGEWSESNFTGFPNESDPYSYSEFMGYAGLYGGELMGLNVHLK
ncbi:MAG: ABC transporter substrate-binding protein [Thermotogae bacterium]|jgi:peptide/nickel transport system substrate-binding protein|nr:ABC transporter substrate-binding protein [Thermotogota bacterium]MCL5031826.1 ABC transporter substrate-binding protein [Thermotogota bacterium]